MLLFVSALIAYIRSFFLARHRLALEAAALRQQLAVFKTQTISTKTWSRGPDLLDCPAETVFSHRRAICISHLPALPV
jgi:hypothetical protein